MNPMIQFIKQLSGRLNSNSYTSILSQSDAGQIAYLRQLQRSIKRDDVLDVPFSELDVVVFDLETTGFYASKGDRILSIGAIKINGNKIKKDETFYSLIYSEEGPSTEIEELTGITKEELLNAPSIENVLIDFYKYIQGNTLVAHHANHERSFMEHMSWSVLRTHFEHRIVDTMFLTKIIERKEKLITLDECCNYFCVENEQRHHALHDAIATAKVWTKSTEILEKQGLTTLKDVYSYLASNK
ncbi:exonuclease domain-containing protein [Evansella sp. AB-rgal1]|uniref:exonuclease domain-containing protein n=1 Tax=Evansella sp. AB-rgal1 TaxID=3242696 RepID=UPI00359EEFF5